MDISENQSNAECKESFEKELVRKYFDFRTKGFFVEVGANEPTSSLSQTWHLENIGWRGILIEPLMHLSEKIINERPNSVLYSVACSSSENTGTGALKIPIKNGTNLDTFASLEYGSKSDDYDEYEYQDTDVVTLDSILEKERVDKVNFISIDVEGTELDVLNGFDLTKYEPDLILIEDKLVFLDKHIYLKKNGYKLVYRTGFNNWYIPKSSNFKFAKWSDELKLSKKFFFDLFFRKLRISFINRSLRPFSKM